MDYMMDPLTLVPTDFVPIVNIAWDASFSKQEQNMTAITAGEWNPLNYELLSHFNIQATMTNSKVLHYKSLLKTNNQIIGSSLNQASTVVDSVGTTQPLCELTDDFKPNYDLKYLCRKPVEEVLFHSNLSFTSGRSKMVIESLIHHDNLMRSRENIKQDKSTGD